MSFVYYPLFLFASMVSTRLKISLPCWKVSLNPLDLVTFDRLFLTIYNLLLVPLGFLTLLKSILFVYILKLFLFHLRFIKPLTIVFLSDLITLKVSIVSEFWHIFSFQHCFFVYFFMCNFIVGFSVLCFWNPLFKKQILFLWKMLLFYLFMLLCLSHLFYSILNYFASLFLASWLKCSVNDLQNFKKSIQKKKAPNSIFTFRNCQRHFYVIQSCYKQLWQGYRRLSTNVLCSVMADSLQPHGW